MQMSRLDSVLLEHAHSPYHRGTPANCTATGSLSSLQCGDQVTLYLKVDEGTLLEVWHAAQGCIVCQAAGSYLCDWAESQSLETLQRTTEAEFLTPFGPLTPLRRECALLPLRCLQKMLESCGEAVQ